MKASEAFGGHIVYVLRDYPVPSERFIHREIRALLQLGVSLRIVTLLPGVDTETVGDLPDISIWRRPSWYAPRLWMPALRAIIRNPAKVLQLMRLAWSVGSQEGSWGQFRGLRWALVALFFASGLNSNQTALIHAHFASAPATLALLLARWMKLPWGFSCHASDVYAEAVHLRAKAERANHLTACSERLAEDICQRLPSELHGRVHTVHHGLDLHQWKAEEPAGGTAPEPRILGVGRLVPKKGFDVLIEACGLLRNDGFRFCCELIGAGPEKENLARRITASGLDSQLRIIPWKTPVVLRQAYARSSVLVMPSVVAADGNRDNIPNVVLEALACGVPVVASALPGIERILGGSQAGRLVPPGDPLALAKAIREVCSDAKLARGLREAGRRLVERHFDQAVNVCHLHSLLEDSRVQGHLGRGNFRRP